MIRLHPRSTRPDTLLPYATRFRSLGVVLTIAPWNYPYLTAVNSIVPALMAGNAVVLKHAAQTLLVGERFQAACDKAGLPQGLFTNLCMSHGQVGKVIGARLADRKSTRLKSSH